MNLLDKIEYLKQVSRKGTETLDPQLFKVLAAFLSQELLDTPEIEKQYQVINKAISNTIGPGHSLYSCGQFIEGKKGQEVILRNKALLVDFFKIQSPDPTHK